ncbi:MAG: hypothetical protein V1674_06205 [Candidatus Omnitrophota bacterium]
MDSNISNYKICFRCGEKKDTNSFYKYKVGNKVYFRGACNECWHKQIVDYRKGLIVKKPKINYSLLTRKICIKCGEKKDTNSFYKYKVGNKVYFRGACNECWHKQIVKLKYEYSYKNPIYFYFHLMASARKRKLEVSITKDDFVEWWEDQEKRCFYCKRNFDNIRFDTDKLNKKLRRLTIDRINNKLGYTINNIVLCCYRCNSIKGNFFDKDEMLEIGKIIHDKFMREK